MNKYSHSPRIQIRAPSRASRTPISSINGHYVFAVNSVGDVGMIGVDSGMVIRVQSLIDGAWYVDQARVVLTGTSGPGPTPQQALEFLKRAGVLIV